MYCSKPSATWRTGWTLYDGWPAQEGGTDGRAHEARSNHNMRVPAQVLAEVHNEPEPEVPWEHRYPAWWADTQEDEKGDLEARSGPHSLREAWVESSILCPPPQHQQKASKDAGRGEAGRTDGELQPSLKAEATQTAASGSCRLRSAHMPCMRHANRRPQAQSKVAAALRNDEAYRKQMASMRRARLGAVAAGASPMHAPLRSCGAAGPGDALWVAERFLAGELAPNFLQSARSVSLGRRCGDVDDPHLSMSAEELLWKPSGAAHGWDESSQAELLASARGHAASRWGIPSEEDGDRSPPRCHHELAPRQRFACEQAEGIAARLGTGQWDVPRTHGIRLAASSRLAPLPPPLAWEVDLSDTPPADVASYSQGNRRRSHAGWRGEYDTRTCAHQPAWWAASSLVGDGVA